MYLGLYAAELMSFLFEEHDPHPDIYDRLEGTLAELSTPRAEEAFLAFQLDLMRESGYLPELAVCVGCHSPLGPRDATYFSASRGGVACRNCEGAMPDRLALDPRLIGLLQAILRLPKTNGSTQRLPRLTRHQTDPINRVFADHMQHTLGRKLRLTDYVF
jgi:DNA repair protein RecO (recombination protein O)